MYLLCYVQAKSSVVAKMQLFSYIHTRVSLFVAVELQTKKTKTTNIRSKKGPVQKCDCCSHVTLHLTAAVALHCSSQTCDGSVFQQSRGKHAQQKTVFTRETQHFSRAEKQLTNNLLATYYYQYSRSNKVNELITMGSMCVGPSIDQDSSLCVRYILSWRGFSARQCVLSHHHQLRLPRISATSQLRRSGAHCSRYARLKFFCWMHDTSRLHRTDHP